MAEYLKERYINAASVLPPALKAAANRVPDEIMRKAEEFRMRVGQAFTVTVPDGEVDVGGFSPPSGRAGTMEITVGDLGALLEIATRGSVYASMGSIKNGFIPIRGGHRLGLCGTAVAKDGEVSNIKRLSSASLRIAKEARTAADGVIPELLEGEKPVNTLILSPPGGGKTTLLRDIIRRMSAGIDMKPVRVAVADERGEIAAMYDGRPQLDIGPHTDVLEGCAKSQAVIMLLRAMNPQVVAIDEVTAPEDIEALTQAANCGVSILATAHADGIQDLFTRPLYKRLANQGIFSRALTIKRLENRRVIEILSMPGGGAP